MNKIICEKECFLNITEANDFEIFVPTNSNAYLDIKASALCNIHIVCEEYSSLELCIIDNCGNVNKKIDVYNNASLTGIIGHFGSGEDNDIINLLGERASSDIKIVCMANNDEIQNIHAHVFHNAINTFGNVRAYCVAKNKGNILFDGVNKIYKGNHGSNSSLHIRGMILHDTAKIAANPALLIDEFDVSANHGATVGKISDDGLYYLMSRGISKEEATMLIVNGFLIPIIESIKNDDTKKYFMNNTQTDI